MSHGRSIFTLATLLLLALTPGATAMQGIAKAEQGYACAGYSQSAEGQVGDDLFFCADARDDDLCYVTFSHEGDRTCAWTEDCFYGEPPCLYVEAREVCLRDRPDGDLCVYETERDVCFRSRSSVLCEAKCVPVYIDAAAVCERTTADRICVDLHGRTVLSIFGHSPVTVCERWPPQTRSGP